MRLTLIVLTVVALFALPCAAQFVAPGGVIPVVANIPGYNDTFWRSDVFVLNPTVEDTSVVLWLYPEIGEDGTPAFEASATDAISLPAGEQLTLANVVQNRFAKVNTKGALWVYSTDGTPLVIASRTYTDSPSGGGTYGQEVTGVLVSGSAWAAGLEHDGFYRTNVGIFWPWDLDDGSVQFEVRVYDMNGVEAGSGTLQFSKAGVQQVNLSVFDVDLLTNGYAVITCSDSTSIWYAYASRVDQITGDAVYRVARGYMVAK